MKKLTKSARLKLAQQFFELVWYQIQEGDDSIYEEIDPDCEYGNALCEALNNDTILEVLRIGFKKKFGQELECGKETSR